MTAQRSVPASFAALVMAYLSVPLAFLAQLCALALVLAMVVGGLFLYARFRVRKNGVAHYDATSLRRMQRAGRVAMLGGACALVMWGLWASGILLG